MRRRNNEVNDNHGQEEGWVWGNHRGGGGAPLKDANGNTLTNLKGAMQQGQVGSDRGGGGGGRGNNRNNSYHDSDAEDDYGYVPSNHRDRRPPPQQQQLAAPHPRAAAMNARDRDRDRDYDSENYGNSSPRRGQRSPTSPMGGSPKKFMSALQDMYGNQKEKSEKLRRELEYQNALKMQIEENKRKKEEEKRKEEEMKQREYDEYVRGAQPGKRQQQQQENSFSRNSSFHEEGGSQRANHQTDKEDYDSNPPNLRGRKPRPAPPLERDEEEDWRGGKPPAKGGAVGRNNPRGIPRRVGVDDSYDADEGGYGRGARGPPPRGKIQDDVDVERGRGGERFDGNGKRYVSPEAYDELSALCDRLLQQQEQLQAELHQQASIIKELQQKRGPAAAAAAVGKGGVNGRPPLAGRNEDKPRSKSVQQPRPGPTAAAAKKDAGSNLAQQRPSSMYQLSSGSSNGNNNISNKNGAAGAGGKKGLKVAFGGPVEPTQTRLSQKDKVKEKEKEVPKKRGVPGLALNGEKAIQKVPLGGAKAAVGIGNGRGPVASDSEPTGRGGFQQLQQRVNRVSGPVIVSYEDEENNGGAGLELRGQSRYVPVRDEDYNNYEDNNFLHNDQLDHLLAKNRRGKFA